MTRLRVLAVDDNEVFLDSIKTFLSAVDNVSVVGCATSGEEALRRADELQPDLVLMDLAMPGMSGLQATRLLKQTERSPRVVILTMHDSREYRAAAVSAGADGFVAKSEFAEKLLPLINSLLHPPESKVG